MSHLTYENNSEKNALPLLKGFETKSGEATESAAISSCEEPLKKCKEKAKTEAFEKHSNLSPA